MIKKIDHVGIVVEDLDQALKIYSNLLGLKCVEKREIEDVGLKIAVLQGAEIFIELLEYRNLNSEMVKALRGDRKGLNHVCYEVEQFDEVLKRLEMEKFQLIPGFPRKGVHGRIAFLIPPHSSEERIEILEAEAKNE
jgi:methylmalonyl-CoA/ethylmalonyl-CoA epimerase